MYPIRKHFGAYESWLLRLYGRRRCVFADDNISNFLTHFPSIKGWEQLVVADIEEFRQWCILRGTNPRSLDIEIQQVGYLYRWLKDDCAYSLHNPVSSKRYKRPESKNRLSLLGLKRFMMHANGELKRWVIAQIHGYDYDCCYKAKRLKREITFTAKLCGMPWITNAKRFKELLNGIWIDIIRLEYPPQKGSEWDDCT